MAEQKAKFNIKIRGAVGLLFFILVFVALFFVAKGIFNLLTLLAPVLLVAALLINYKTVVGYGKFLLDLLKKNPLAGILGGILTVIGLPIVSGFLFGKSILDRKVKQWADKAQAQVQGEMIEYEDVTEEAEVLELKTIEKEKPAPSAPEDTTYDDLLEN